MTYEEWLDKHRQILVYDFIETRKTEWLDFLETSYDDYLFKNGASKEEEE